MGEAGKLTYDGADLVSLEDGSVFATKKLIGIFQLSSWNILPLKAEQQESCNQKRGQNHDEPHPPVPLEAVPSFEEGCLELVPEVLDLVEFIWICVIVGVPDVIVWLDWFFLTFLKFGVVEEGVFQTCLFEVKFDVALLELVKKKREAIHRLKRQQELIFIFIVLSGSFDVIQNINFAIFFFFQNELVSDTEPFFDFVDRALGHDFSHV